jgi:hypothetical protein
MKGVRLFRKRALLGGAKPWSRLPLRAARTQTFGRVQSG